MCVCVQLHVRLQYINLFLYKSLYMSLHLSIPYISPSPSLTFPPPHPLHFLLPVPYISSSSSLTSSLPAFSRQLADLCVDDRAAVRKSALQTLFSTISAHDTILCQETWHEVLAQVCTYVCTCVVCKYVCVCLCVECVHMTIDSLSFHGITVA